MEKNKNTIQANVTEENQEILAKLRESGLTDKAIINKALQLYGEIYTYGPHDGLVIKLLESMAESEKTDVGSLLISTMGDSVSSFTADLYSNVLE